MSEEPDFRFGDRVRSLLAPSAIGTVINESGVTVMGDFESMLPYPVAVRWDEPGESWWESGEDLEKVE